MTPIDAPVPPDRALAVVPDQRRGPGRPCTTCHAPNRAAVEKAISEGLPYRRISRQTGVPFQSIRHHACQCVPALLAKAGDLHAQKDAQTADTVLGQVTLLVTRCEELLTLALEDAEATHRDKAAWFRELRATLELLARLRGELTTTTVINLSVVLQSPQWREHQASMLEALRPFPAALAAFVAALPVPMDAETVAA